MDRGSELMRCLSLVRPVGMGDDMAADWLAVAMVEVRNMSDAAFGAGAQKARANCTHHGQIIPAILSGAEVVKPDPLVSSFLSNWRGPKGVSRIEGPKSFKELTGGWSGD